MSSATLFTRQAILAAVVLATSLAIDQAAALEAGDPSAHDFRTLLLAHSHFSSPEKELDTRPSLVSPEQNLTLHIHKTQFSCTDDHCEHFYQRCGLQIEYSVARSGSLLGDRRAEITCSARIAYSTMLGDTFIAETGPESVEATAGVSPKACRLCLEYHFSRYEQVVEARLDRLECRARPLPMKKGNLSKGLEFSEEGEEGALISLATL